MVWSPVLIRATAFIASRRGYAATMLGKPEAFNGYIPAFFRNAPAYPIPPIQNEEKMTLKEFIDMARRYDIDPEMEITVQPLLKDKIRKVTNITLNDGKIILHCNVIKKQPLR